MPQTLTPPQLAAIEKPATLFFQLVTGFGFATHQKIYGEHNANPKEHKRIDRNRIHLSLTGTLRIEPTAKLRKCLLVHDSVDQGAYTFDCHLHDVAG